MSIDESLFPGEVISCVKNDLSRDILFDGHTLNGNNGYVFFGYHKIQKKRVAIKFYYYGESFHDEVSLLSEITSTNILTILHARTIDNGFAYFVTEEISGGDLDSHLENEILSLRHGIALTKGILNGVIEFHRQENRLVHRDLKPANILIDSNSNPLIADFGSLKRIPDDQHSVNGSRHAALYRPPESYDDEYTFRSDIYQVGMVMYQLLGGHLPYDPEVYLSNSQMKIYHKLPGDFERSKYIDEILKTLAIKGKLLNFDSLPYYVSKSIRKIISKATNPDPDKRYETASIFMLKLHQLGILPDWKKIKNEYWLINQDKKDFRVVPCKKHRLYQCIKSKTGIDNWRRESFDDDTQKAIVEKLMLQIGQS